MKEEGYLNAIALHIPAHRPLPAALLAALIFSVLLHAVMLAFHLTSTTDAAKQHPVPLNVKIKRALPAQQPATVTKPESPASQARENPVPQASVPADARANTTQPESSAIEPAAPPPAVSVPRPRDWQAAARTAIDAYTSRDANPFAAPPEKREAFAPSRVEQTDISALAREFRPVPGPHRMCGRMASINTGMGTISVPVAYPCAPGEKSPGEIRDDDPRTSH